MPKKNKTIQAIDKRFKKTKGGKFKKIRDNQNHFNSKERGKNKRNKRSDLNLSKADSKLLRKVTG